MTARFFATTIPGIEDIAAHEIKNLLKCKAIPDVGKVFFDADVESVYRLNLTARTLHKVMIQLCRSNFEDLNEIYKIAKSIDYTWIIDPNQTFAVRSERVGTHNFTSVDVSRVVGQAVIDSFIESANKRLKVNLNMPDVEICCLVRNREFLMGINTTGESLHKRGYRVYDHPAALNPTLASAMIYVSEWKPDEPIIDPMCGGATIPIEAALRARNIAPNRLRQNFALLKLKIFNNEEFKNIKKKILDEEKDGFFEIYGMEKFIRHLKGGKLNAEKAGVSNTVHLKLGDATRPSDYPDLDFKFVIVNPPYGLRMTPNESVKKLYEKFLGALKGRAEGAVLVLITAAHRRFRESAEKTEVTIINERRVLHGGLTAMVFKCKMAT